MPRAFVIMLDSFGLGATKDAAEYGDVGRKIPCGILRNIVQKAKQIKRACAQGR